MPDTESILAVLKDPDADWTRNPPASESAVKLLKKSLGPGVPADYFTFLRYSNGGSGNLEDVTDGGPVQFNLHPAERIVSENAAMHSMPRNPDILHIGNIGGIGLGFDKRATPWKVCQISYYNLGPYLSGVIAADFVSFVRMLGRWRAKPWRRIPVESSNFEAFASKEFWERFIYTAELVPNANYPEFDQAAIEFRVSPMDKAALLTTFNVGIDMHTLNLAESTSSMSADWTELGWFDLGHWMPYALRWEEATALSQCIAARISNRRHKMLPLLLLTHFVPFFSVEDPKPVRDGLRAAWKSIGLFSPRQITGFVEVLMQGEDEWKWRRIPRFGWVFDENGYSLRIKGNEKFPFAALGRFLRRAERTFAR